MEQCVEIEIPVPWGRVSGKNCLFLKNHLMFLNHFALSSSFID